MTYTPRPLDVYTLNNAAKHYADQFGRDSIQSQSHPDKYIAGREYCLHSLYDAAYKDEFEYLLPRVRAELERRDANWLAKFDRFAATRFSPRREDVFEQELAERLAIRPDGTHIPGMIGRVQIGQRKVGMREKHLDRRAPQTFWQRMWGEPGDLLERRIVMRTEKWPVYAGEVEERLMGSPVPDPLPEGAEAFNALEMLALNPRISNECALLACDAIVDNLDEGTGAAVIQGRTGAQPADPDTVVSGTLLFTLVMSATAFGAAADDNPGGKATAAAITDDSSADATGTLGYCRVSSTNDGATPLDDHIDGEAGISGADFNFNTLSIVSGSTVSMTAFTVTVPESG